MDVELPDGSVIEGVPDGMSQRDLVSLLSKNGHDTSWYKAPEPGFVDRIKTALTPDPNRAPMPSTAETINAPSGEFDTGATEAPEGRISLPGSVMDGFVPRENGQGMPIDAGVGPMRQSYYDETRAGLLSAPIQAHGELAQRGGGQVGKVARATLPDRVADLEREAAGDSVPRTQQEFIDDVGQGRVNRMDDGLAKLSDETGKWAEEFAKSDPRKAELLGGVMRTGGGIWGAVSALLPEGSIPAEVADVSAQFADRLATDLQKQDFATTDDKLGWMLSQTLANAPSAAMSIMGMLNPASAPLVIGSLSASSGGGQYRKLIREGVDRDVATAAGVAYGIAEGVFERLELGVGSALIKRLNAMPVDVLANAGKRILQGAAKGAGIVGVAGAGEAGEEVLTEISQIGTDVATGLAHEARHGPSKMTAEMTDLNPLKVSNKLINAGMGGPSAGGALSTPQIAIGAVEGYKAGDLTTGRDFNQDTIDAAARQALNPANAQMTAIGPAPSIPVVPRATPADVAVAETPAAAAAAIADMGAGIAGAAPISETLASTQAEIDALLSEPIESAAPSQTPAVPPMAQPGAVAADLRQSPVESLSTGTPPIVNVAPQAVPEAGVLPEQLTPGTPEYNAYFEKKAAAEQEKRDADQRERRRLEGQAAVDKKNSWRGKLIAWFDGAKDGDTITTDMEGDEYRVIEKTIDRGGKKIQSKRLVQVGGMGEGRDKTVIEYRDGTLFQGPNTNQTIDPSAGFAQTPETDADGIGAQLGQAMEDGRAIVGAGTTPIVTQQSDNPVPPGLAQMRARVAEREAEVAAASTNKESLTVPPTIQPASTNSLSVDSEISTPPDVQPKETTGIAPSVNRIRGGKLEITGFGREEVADVLKTAKIAATVTAGKDGRVLVSATDRAGNATKISIKQQNAISKALLGAPATAKKPRKLSGNLKNDLDIIAPGLYGEVARGGDGEANDAAWGDVSLIAEKMRDEQGYMLPHDASGQELANALRELIRQHAGGDIVLNEARQAAAMTEEETKRHRSDVLRLADEYGIETKRGIIPRRLEDVEAELASAIEAEIGLAGRGAMSAYEAAIAAGIPESEADAIIDRVAESYNGDTSRDAWVRQYRDQANALQEAIDANQEREGRAPEIEDAAETPGQGEERPALELAGQSAEEIRADEERVEAAEAQRAKDEQTAENKRKADAERDSFLLTGSDRPADVLAAQGQQDIFSTPIDAAAHEAATSHTNDKPAPTPAQMEAGNYAKGHIRIHGLDISIETPKGSERVAKDGSWRVPSMPAHYGYIKGTVGADKDHVDVFVDPNPESAKAWIINQVVPDTSPALFDEHKVMLGFGSAEDAKDAYLGSFEGDFGAKVFGSMTQALTIEQLKAKIEGGNLSRKKFVGPVAAEATGERGVTADTRPPPKPETPAKTPADAGVSVSAPKKETAAPQPENILEEEKSRLTIDAVPPARLKKITVSVDALVGDQQQKIEVPVKQAIADINEEIRAYELLLACVKG